jgi:hypothetical protein
MVKIKLLEGFNDIEFGISKEKFIEQMGEPDQVETISEDEDPVTTILLQYEEHQSSFFFEGKNEKYYLNSCDTSHPDAEIFGKKIFDLNPNACIQLFNEMGFGKHETATEEWGEMRLTFENSMADLYFENKKLSSLIWGY